MFEPRPGGTGAAAVARFELRRRLRRKSALAAFALVLVFTYTFIPPPDAGYITLSLAGQRGFPNSDFVGTSTAMMAGLLVSLVGFYLLHGGVPRDDAEGLGRLVAASPLSSASYLFGKFLGGAAYLGLLALAPALGAVLLFPWRGAGAFEPLRILWPFWLAVPGSALFAAAAALLFDTVRALRGRGGDVLYFFAWTGFLTTTLLIMDKGGYVPWLDFTGSGLVMAELHRMGIHELSFGVVMDPPPLAGAIVWHGIPARLGLAVGRLAVAAVPLGLVLATLPFFSRFDPARERRQGRGGRKPGGRAMGRRSDGPGRQIAAGAHGATAGARGGATGVPGTAAGAGGSAPGIGLETPPRGASLPARVLAEARLTVLRHRRLALALAAGGLASLAFGFGGVSRFAVLGAFLIAAPLIADLPVYLPRGPYRTLAASLPGGLSGGALARSLAVPLLLCAFTLLPAVLWQLAGGSILRVWLGVAAVSAACVLLGRLTRTGKTFTLLFVVYWYLGVSAGADVPRWLDFAGVLR